MRRALLLLVLAACGDNLQPREAARPCMAGFTGNFVESSTTDQCAAIMVDDSGNATLALTIPTMTLTPSVMVSIALGSSPSEGAYSPETVSSWSARGVQNVGQGVCLYTAGTTAVPTGDFSLSVDELAAPSAHGSLDLTMYVLPFPGTSCGPADTEQVELQF